MIRGRKSLLAIFSLLLISVMMISCGKKEKISIEETIGIVYNAIFYGDSTGVEKVGMTKEEIEELQEKQRSLTIETIKNNFVNNGLEISDDKVEEIYVARCNALKKLSVSVETINTDGKVANVKVGTTYIREMELDQKAAMDAIETGKQEGLTDPDSIKYRLVDLYINNLIEAYNNVEVSKDYRYTKRQFKLIDGNWEIEDSYEFGEELAKLAIENKE